MKHKPYIATPSLRKLIKHLPEKHKITELKAKSNIQTDSKTETEQKLGMTIEKKKENTVTIKYKGAGIRRYKPQEKLQEIKQHDINIDQITIKTPATNKFKKAINQKWRYKQNNARTTKALINMDLDPIEKYYITLEDKKIDFDPTEHYINEHTTFKEFWEKINTCEQCGKPLTDHGFKQTTLIAQKVEIPYIKHTLRKKQRPKINPWNSEIAKRIYHDILPSTLTSGMFKYRTGKKDEDILEGIGV